MLSYPSFPSLGSINYRSDATLAGLSYPFPKFYEPRYRTFAVRASAERIEIEQSWSSSGWNDGYGGWSIAELQLENKKKAFSSFLSFGIGASIALGLAVTAHVAFSGKGFRPRWIIPLHDLQSLLVPSWSKGITIDASETKSEDNSSITHLELDDYVGNRALETGQRSEQLIIPVDLDSTQQDALIALRKLKIIEDDIKPDMLCTRREYARWLVKTNSLLERNPKFRILSSVSIAGSTLIAFDDISMEDPDFWCVQCLAEAGVIPSKLSLKNSSCLDVVSAESLGRVDFSPESYVNRWDLLNWKAQLEYPILPGIEEKVSKIGVGFLDMREATLDASPQMFEDLLAGDRSIFRRVFGTARRFQPFKPATKAQAAVALVSGRMGEAIRAELSRLDAEDLAKQTEIEEIRSELAVKGEINKIWEAKKREEKTRYLVAEREILAALHDLKDVKFVENEIQLYISEERAALECQQKLFKLEEEIADVCKRLSAERASFVADQHNLEKLCVDLQDRLGAVVECKSVLEAELEALHSLRSWVEDEARQTQSHANALEKAGERWKWNH